MNGKILLLEDDRGINDLLTMQLRAEGYDVLQVFDGKSAIEAFDETIDLAILDVMVPKCDGFEVLSCLRQKSTIPIIFLTAKNEDLDKMRALGMGADDYVCKPFSVVEVVYRCKAHLRRFFQYAGKPDAEVLVHGDIRLNKRTFEATFRGAPLPLHVKEFELLAYFMTHVGQVFTKQQIYERVWGENYYGDDNTIMVHISRIREKLGDNPKSPVYIKTIKGLGYRMERVSCQKK
ncbi:response regulator transcription factor [Fusibacter sp. JL298sf-3]